MIKEKFKARKAKLTSLPAEALANLSQKILTLKASNQQKLVLLACLYQQQSTNDLCQKLGVKYRQLRNIWKPLVKEGLLEFEVVESSYFSRPYYLFSLSRNFAFSGRLKNGYSRADGIKNPFTGEDKEAA